MNRKKPGGLMTQEEKDEHYYQARLHDCAANTLWNLLNDLESKNYRV